MKNILTLISALLIITSAFAQQKRNLLTNTYSLEKTSGFIVSDQVAERDTNTLVEHRKHGSSEIHR
jgi:hypothetical protein